MIDGTLSGAALFRSEAGAVLMSPPYWQLLFRRNANAVSHAGKTEGGGRSRREGERRRGLAGAKSLLNFNLTAVEICSSNSGQQRLMESCL